MKDLKKIKLVLFFTRGVSLHTWDKIGMFEREVAIYRRLQEYGVQVTFVTYGDATDLKYTDRLSGIRILCNRWGLAARYYERLIPILHSKSLLSGNVYKTNQIMGAEVALCSARIFRKPLIARCGYIWSHFASSVQGYGSELARLAREREHQVFSAADKVVVTTKKMKQYAMEQYGIKSNKVIVIPNYILTDIFRPIDHCLAKSSRICFVGRLDPQKNLFSLLEAIRGLEIELQIIGDGSQRKTLAKWAHENKLNVQFLGYKPYTELPIYFNSAEVFVLPSLYEGHPKTLLEAMSCGLPVIGSNVHGIRELIRHRETGYLCGTLPTDIRSAIQNVLGNKELRLTMGENARKFVVKNFSIDHVLKMELALLHELSSRRSF